MTKLTHEQFDKLSTDQQETLAQIEMRLAHKRRKIMERTRGYPGYFLMPTAIAIVGFYLCFFREERGSPFVFYIFGLLFTLIQFHAVRLNRRLDAFLDLSGTDLKPSVPSPPPSIDSTTKIG